MKVGDCVFLNAAGQAMFKKKVTPRDPEKPAYWRVPAWAKRPLEIAQFSDPTASGRVYVRLHHMKVDKVTGSQKVDQVIMADLRHVTK